jgi:predicted small secreted protein
MTPSLHHARFVGAQHAAPLLGRALAVGTRVAFVIALVAGVLAGVAGGVFPQQELRQSVVVPEEYVIYAVVLRARYFDESVKGYVIAAETNCEHKSTFIGYRAGITFSGATRPEVDKETSADFSAKNNEPYRLNEKLTLSVPYSLVTEADLRKIFDSAGEKPNPEGWNEFYKEYPESPGAISFSRVGFNSKKNQGLLYVARQAGFVNGSGRFFVLSKKDGSWQIEKEVIMWLS